MADIDFIREDLSVGPTAEIVAHSITSPALPKGNIAGLARISKKEAAN
jgi:hypothetical protein